MAIEKKWPAIAPLAFTADGGQNGEVYLASTSKFKVKQVIIIKAEGLPDKILEVKRIVTDELMYVGPNGNIDLREDLSLYTTAIFSTIKAQEQNRPKISPEEYERAMYEEEPTVAKRSILVDTQGEKVSQENPLTVRDREAAVLTNLKTLEALGESLDNFVIVGDELVALSDGTLVKAGE